MPVSCRENCSLLPSLSSASFMGSVPFKPSIRCVFVISETDGHFKRGLMNGFGACWLNRKEPDMVEGAQSPKPDCRHLTGQ